VRSSAIIVVNNASGLGIGTAPGRNLTGIVRDLPANSRSLLMVITQEPCVY
jgi:hypothetical protein